MNIQNNNSLTDYSWNQNSKLIQFYKGKITDSKGRWIHDIQNWDNDRLEYTHDYIQWLFPLREKSRFNPKAPILEQEQINAFKTDLVLRDNLIKSFINMLKFYGFEYTTVSKGIVINFSEEWKTRKRNWLSKGNHNHLRITRILASMRILGLPDYSKAFFKVLSKLFYSDEGAELISKESFEFWKRASGYNE